MSLAKKSIPIHCQSKYQDVINVAFEVEQEVTIFWNNGVNFVVCKIQGRPHDSRGGAHGGAQIEDARRPSLRIQTGCFS